MKKIVFSVVMLLILLLTTMASSVFAASEKPMNKAFQVTTEPKYDRNPNIFRAIGGNYWLFYTRGKDNRGVRDFDGYNPDLDYYEICYRTGRSVANLQNENENIISLNHPDNAERDVSALQTKNKKILVFASTGLGPGSERSVYCYTYDGKWKGPVPVPGTDCAAHINALEYKGKIWLFFDIGYKLQVVSCDSDTLIWSAPVEIKSDATIAKAIVDNGNFYVVSTTPSGSGIYLSTSANGKNWTSIADPIASWTGSGVTNWDPVLIKDEGGFRLFWAPDALAEGQFIATSVSKNPAVPASWSTPVKLTTSNNGANSWWDFWPQPFKSEGATYLFYTSERNSAGTDRTDGNIWMMPVPDKPFK
jgi:hypothetical protein